MKKTVFLFFSFTTNFLVHFESNVVWKISRKWLKVLSLPKEETKSLFIIEKLMLQAWNYDHHVVDSFIFKTTAPYCDLVLPPVESRHPSSQLTTITLKESTSDNPVGQPLSKNQHKQTTFTPFVPPFPSFDLQSLSFVRLNFE